MAQTTSRTASRGPALLTVAAALVLVACAPEQREERVQPAPGAGVVLSDDEITAIVMTANAAEIQEGQLALQKSRNDAVRQFAQRMINDYGSIQQQFMAHHGRPEAEAGRSPLTQQLSANERQTINTLQQLEGMRFDRTYMQHQVEVHEWLLSTLDNALIPSARDNTLERDLRSSRDIIASHLQQAREIRGSLAK